MKMILYATSQDSETCRAVRGLAWQSTPHPSSRTHSQAPKGSFLNSASSVTGSPPLLCFSLPETKRGQGGICQEPWFPGAKAIPGKVNT